MGIKIYGSFDHLIIELSGVDMVWARRRAIRIPVDVITTVDAAGPATVEGLRDVVARAGSRRRPAVVFSTVGGGRYVVHCADAHDVADELRGRGVCAATTSV